MKLKKSLIIIAVILSFIAIFFEVNRSSATTLPTVAIIDTGYDPSVTQFAGKIIHEECYTTFFASCPNGKSTMSLSLIHI